MAVRLAIDASQHIASCALSDDLNTISCLTMEHPIENMVLLVQDTLANSHIGLNNIEEIIVCIGPGSNMGARAAVVTGNALSLALDIPITGIISTDSLAVFSPFSGKQIVAVPAGRGHWFSALYDCSKDKIERLEMPKLIDCLPENNSRIPVFTPSDVEEGFICANGLIGVAKSHRQLIKQSLLKEITIFEQEGS